MAQLWSWALYKEGRSLVEMNRQLQTHLSSKEHFLYLSLRIEWSWLFGMGQSWKLPVKMKLHRTRLTPQCSEDLGYSTRKMGLLIAEQSLTLFWRSDGGGPYRMGRVMLAEFLQFHQSCQPSLLGMEAR
jgi:hypothetical protein